MKGKKANRNEKKHFEFIRCRACVCVNGENVAYKNKLKQVIRA